MRSGRFRVGVYLVVAVVLGWAGWFLTPRAGNGSEAGRVEAIRVLTQMLVPLHARMGKPRPGDWLEAHPEAGQTFEQYVESDPNVPTAERSVIYIQPLGRFRPGQRQVVEKTAEFVRRYYGMRVVVQSDLPLDLVPASARRKGPTGEEQVLTGYVLSDILKPRLPADAFALVAFTASDLWPGRGWNFVFGQASLRGRVGVWSIHRFGDAEHGGGQGRQCLRRTISTGVHELGHMFGMEHCIFYECVMCGSNNLEEADRRPLMPCPVCLAKILWATKADALGRYRQLEQVCRDYGLDPEAEACHKAVGVLESAGR